MELQVAFSAEFKFLAAFRAVCRCYLLHRKAIKKLHPKYKFECPTGCEKSGYNIRRTEKCEACPLLKAEKIFKAQTLATIEKMIGYFEAEKFDFNKLLQALYAVIGFEDSPKETLSIKNNQLLSIFLSERNYRDELDDLEKK